MDLRQMKCILTVYELQNMTKAARQLYVSQQALSNIVGQVENELGILLFHRMPRGMTPTEAGAYFYKLYKPLLRSLDDAAIDFGNMFNAGKGEIRLAVAPGVLRSIGLRLLLDFQSSYPEISVSRMELLDGQCIDKVISGAVDMGLCPRPCKSGSIVDFLQLHQEPLYAILSKDHPLAGFSVLSMKLLRDYRFVSLNKDHYIYHATIKACEESGFAPDIIVESSEVGFLRSVAAGSDYIFICPGHIAEDGSNLTAIPLQDENMVWPLGFVCKCDSKLSAAAKKLIAFTEAYIKK